jgi:hypothetical protein
VKHAWAGAWVNSLFRREPECEHMASDLIKEAVAVTRGYYGETPELGMITFVDAGKVKRKRDPGRCYKKAGFQRAKCPKHGDTFGPHYSLKGKPCSACAGLSGGGLIALQMVPEAMPEPISIVGQQLHMEAA